MIETLRLQNFRSYVDASFEFGQGVNIVVGPNGSGKTNLLEAIQVLAVGRSYRVDDDELLRFGAPWLRLDAGDSANSMRTVKIEYEPRQKKTLVVDEKSYTRFTSQHLVPVVLFEPNHLQLLHGSPEGRRSYLDDLLEQLSPGFVSFRKNYRRVLSQRNSLLRRGRVSTMEMFPWDLRLSELGAVIARARADLVDEIQAQLPELYRTLARSKDDVAISYKPQFSIEKYESQLLQKLEDSLQRDEMRGFTAHGPHREDFSVTFGGHMAAEMASRGEVRTLVLALKIIEMQLLEAKLGVAPLLLLDDVFSELDGARRRSLTDYLQSHQTFLTTTDADVVVKHFTTSTIIPLG